MAVEAAPATALVVAEADLLLEVLLVALDPPSRLGDMDEVLKRGARGQGGQPVCCGFRLALQPLDQQPLLRPGLGARLIAMRRADLQGGKAQGQRDLAALAPRYRAPGVRRLVRGQGAANSTGRRNTELEGGAMTGRRRSDRALRVKFGVAGATGGGAS